MSEESVTREPVNRAGWTSGPWDGEPDRIEFRTAVGYHAIVLRQPSMGHLCGYVAVPPGHPYHGKSYDSGPRGDYDADEPDYSSHDETASLDVHGGITYGGKCHGPVCHVPAPGEPADVWWLGFDAAHGFDESTRRLALGSLGNWRGSSYKTIGYMRAECERLAEQLKAAEVPQ